MLSQITQRSILGAKGIICESCEPPSKDECCVGVLHNCKIVIKPMVYAYIVPVIIVVPFEHRPVWKLSPESNNNMHKVVGLVSDVFTNKGLFVNFFTGGNINNAKYGLDGVHAHVHIEPRSIEDPAYNTFPAHLEKRMLTKAEIRDYVHEWRKLLNIPPSGESTIELTQEHNSSKIVRSWSQPELRYGYASNSWNANRWFFDYYGENEYSRHIRLCAHSKYSTESKTYAAGCWMTVSGVFDTKEDIASWNSGFEIINGRVHLCGSDILRIVNHLITEKIITKVWVKH
jgi:diadenosine tetraphosphate (Ap4A) HIT family hydrolase